MDLKRGIDLAVEAIVKELRNNARKVSKNAKSPRWRRFRPMAMPRSAATWPKQ